MEELKKRNPPPEPAVPPAPVPCPTPEQWEDLMAWLDALYRVTAVQNDLLERKLSTPSPYATKEQAAEIMRQLSMIQASIEQAGRRNGRQRLRLPRLRLPELSMATLKGMALALMLLAALWILWYASAAVWNNLLKPLLLLQP